jgi:hypothetical protein
MHHIDTLVWDGIHNAAWRGTFIYGEPRTQDRHQMWELMKRLKPCQYAPWVMIGDFNEVLWSYEHFSNPRRPLKQMMDFHEILSFCDLYDIGFQGLSWTYGNKQKGEQNVRVWLDQAVASPNWSQWFLGAKLKHLTMMSSDHFLILLNHEAEESGALARRILRYEIMWERDASLMDEIKRAWESCMPATDLGDVNRTLHNVMGSLKRWSFDTFGAISKELDGTRAKIEDLSQQGVVKNQEEIDRLSKQMVEILYREEMLWLQRSRITWLCEGDRNTSFFHRKAVSRGEKNKVDRLKDDDGTMITDAKVMGEMTRSYFHKLFSADQNVCPDELLQLIEIKVS